MKYLIALIFLCFSMAGFSATCTTTSRTNYSSNQVLTSTALNADFNQLVTKANSFDLGCGTDGTLEFSSLNTSDFASITNGIHQGCALAYSDANTVSVGKCIATVNGYSIKTSVAKTVTWGCSSCSSEVASTWYYVYIKTGSTGTILNLLISTTAPGVDGYDASSNKAIGRFYNNASSAIEQYSFESWKDNGFAATGGLSKTPGATTSLDIFTVHFGATISTICSSASGVVCPYVAQIGTAATDVKHGVGTGEYNLNLGRTYTTLMCTVSAFGSGSVISLYYGTPSSCLVCSVLPLKFVNNSVAIDAGGTISCVGSY